MCVLLAKMFLRQGEEYIKNPVYSNRVFGY